MKKVIANMSFGKKQEKHENCNTTPLLALKTPTSVRASREMAIDRATTIAGVKPCDEERDVLNKTSAGGRNRCRGASSNGSDDGGGTWNGNDNW